MAQQSKQDSAECVVVVRCFDPRFDGQVERWVFEQHPDVAALHISLAGGPKNVTDPDCLPAVQKSIEVAMGHNTVREILLVAHENCKAYSEELRDREHQEEFLRQAKHKLEEFLPEGAKVGCYWQQRGRLPVDIEA